MLKRLALSAFIPLVIASCGPPPEPPGPPPLDPTGTFDITFEADGMAINGILVIEEGLDGGYTGSVDTEMGGTSISNITVSGQTMTFYVAEADGTVEVTFEGENFAGFLSSSMFSADLYGTRRPGS